MGAQSSENHIEPETEAALSDVRPEQPVAARLNVTGTQVCASTLASVSAAVVASIFGVAGTVVGAAVVSVIATTGSAVYSHGIHRTGVRLQQTQAVRLTRPLGLWKQRVADTGATGGSDASAAPATAPSSSSRPNRSPSGWRDWLSKRRWGVAASTAIVFVASLTTVTLIELVGQQPLAAISGNEPSGNTSIGSLFDDGGQDTPAETPTTADPSVSPTSTDTSEPSGDPEPSTTSPETTDPSSPTTEE